MDSDEVQATKGDVERVFARKRYICVRERNRIAAAIVAERASDKMAMYVGTTISRIHGEQINLLQAKLNYGLTTLLLVSGRLKTTDPNCVGAYDCAGPHMISLDFKYEALLPEGELPTDEEILAAAAMFNLDVEITAPTIEALLGWVTRNTPQFLVHTLNHLLDVSHEDLDAAKEVAKALLAVV